MNKLKRKDPENYPCCWWLRSAHANNSSDVGYVYYYGDVDYDYAYNISGVLSVCKSGIRLILEL